MTTPPSYREQEACANCRWERIKRRRYITIGEILAMWRAGIRSWDYLESHAICDAHERREAGRG